MPCRPSVQEGLQWCWSSTGETWLSSSSINHGEVSQVSSLTVALGFPNPLETALTEAINFLAHQTSICMLFNLKMRHKPNVHCCWCNRLPKTFKYKKQVQLWSADLGFSHKPDNFQVHMQTYINGIRLSSSNIIAIYSYLCPNFPPTDSGHAQWT